MRPYPGTQLVEASKVFNYRLSRARRIVENAFGILAARWRIYQRRLQLDPKNVERVVKATCCLHNFLQNDVEPPSVEDNTEEFQETLRTAEAFAPLPRPGNRGAREAVAVRDYFRDYFNSTEGCVPWQMSVVRNPGI